MTDELKVLFEESYPLKLFCEHYFSQDSGVILQQVLGSQQHDVVVSNCHEFEYIEITQAINGEKEALRMKKLNEDGHVSASGAIGKKGNKSHGTLVIYFDELEEFDYDVTLIEEKFLSELIETAVRKKVAKNYPDKTILLIAFDDYIKTAIGIDMSDLADYMKDVVKPMIQSSFFMAVLVGFSGKTFFSTH